MEPVAATGPGQLLIPLLTVSERQPLLSPLPCGSFSDPLS